MSAHDARVPRYAALEAGGTKMVCAVGDAHGALLEQWRCPTEAPAPTLAAVTGYLREAAARFGPLAGLGIGTFGPVDLDRASPRYGHLISTPKPGWSGTDLAGSLAHALSLPVALDTDVNAAALAEGRWGAGVGLESLAYVTVGTGVGVGVVHGGRAVHGLMHPEAGHLPVRRHPLDERFRGHCPFHRDCIEGMVSGPAIHARCGQSLAEAGPADPIWEIVADYLGQLCAALVLTHSPQAILMGGGVMQQQRLFAPVRERMRHHLGGYPDLPALHAPDYVRAPGLGTEAGIKGALALAIG